MPTSRGSEWGKGPVQILVKKVLARPKERSIDTRNAPEVSGDRRKSHEDIREEEESKVPPF